MFDYHRSQEAQLPSDLKAALRRCGVRPTRWLLIVSINRQRLRVLEQTVRVPPTAFFPCYQRRWEHLISTSAWGVGQTVNSNQTPLGLHRVARKIGGGQPIGTVFRSRQPVGRTWQGLPQGAIVHRIFWLEGMEPGFNRGGEVDTFRRYIYIHGFGDETTLGRPNSHGCVHLAAKDLIPLYDYLPAGTLVWIARE